MDRVEGMQAVRTKLKKQELDQQSNASLLRMIEMLEARMEEMEKQRQIDIKVGGEAARCE